MRKVMLFLITISLILLNSALAGITKEELLKRAPQLKKIS